MASRYEVILKVVETGSFTKAGEALGYSQSAISQTVKAVETWLGTKLFDRKGEPLALTSDGKTFLPYFQNIVQAQKALERKQAEMQGLLHSHIRIGIFTSVGRTLLAPLVKQFSEQYQAVRFDLSQGEYDSIRKELLQGQIDLGFMDEQSAQGLAFEKVYRDTMVAVLPKDSPLGMKKEVSLKELAPLPFIELDEGRRSHAIEAFHSLGIEPNKVCKVYDDYTILSMIRQGVGYSILYSLVVNGYDDNLVVRPVKEKLSRSVVLAFAEEETMPIASLKFLSYARKRLPSLVRELGL